MEKFIALLLVFALQVSGSIGDVASGTKDGSEEWGYTDVREGAHIFWWLYLNNESSIESTPIVFWLQGGPGSSGVGYGNFEEIGPLTSALKDRESTWLKFAHLLFVDNPVGTGYSYVDNTSLLCKTNKEVSDDLIVFFKSFFKTHEALRKSPFYIVAESYGGKFASEVGVTISRSLGELDFNFKGVALGDTWISPIDFLYAWGPLLKSFSLVDEAGNEQLNRYADLTASEIEKGNLLNATFLWGDMEDAVLRLTDNVDFYNLLKHESDALEAAGPTFLRRSANDPLNEIMNGPIREKIGIIPENIIWGQSSGTVFGAMSEDFMLDTIDKVDELLALGVKVTIYSGQLDLICCTTGTEAWVQKLKWPGLAQFNATKRTAFSCPKGTTGAFVKRYENLTFYWIMNAGHMIPSDNPCMASKMLQMILEEGERNDVPMLAEM